MTWKAYSTEIRTAPLKDNTFPYNENYQAVYLGVDDDFGYKLYYSSSLSKWVISLRYGMIFLSGVNEFIPTYKNINGYSSYIQGSNVLWYDASTIWTTWIISTTPGISPVEYWLADDPVNDPSGAGSYQGTAFYTGTPPALGGSATFQARGSLRGTTKDAYSGTPITITTQYQRWESSTLYGKYTAAGGASGTKYCGLPQWKDGDDNAYVRSLTKTDGKYSYGSISYNSTYSKWLIGTYGNVSGWYEGSEPSKTSPVTFTFTVPDGSELTGTNKTITFDEYVKGENTEIVLLTEASRWL